MSRKMKKAKVETTIEKIVDTDVSESDTSLVNNQVDHTASENDNAAETSAQDAVQRLEPLELERFCRFEAEIRNRVQGMRILDLELLELKRTLQAKANEAAQRKVLLENELNCKWKISYDAFCKDLAEKYGIKKPAHILIDTDAGTIRDSGAT